MEFTEEQRGTVMRSLLPERKAIGAYTVDEILLMLFGILGPMSIITIGSNTVFSYLMLLVIAWNLFLIFFVEKGFLKINRTMCLPVLIVLEAFVSVVICQKGTQPAIWKEGQTTGLLWEVCFGAFFLLYHRTERKHLVRYYIKGVYISSVIQIFWCLAQYAYYMKEKASLNAWFFGQILHMKGFNGNFGDDILRGINGIALTGFCWHPSNMAPLVCIAFLFSHSLWVKLVAVMVAAMCGNRTALVGVAICAVGEMLCWCWKNRKYMKVTQLYVGIAVSVLLAVVLYCVVYESALIERVMATLNFYIEKTVNHEKKFSAHIQYWTCFLQEMEVVNIWQFLYGLGVGCSGYIASTLFHMYPGEKWVMECDYLNIFWNFGLAGFLLRYIWYGNEAVKAVRNQKKLWIFFMAIAVMGVFYNVLYNWMIIFLYSVFALNAEKRRTEEGVG